MNRLFTLLFLALGLTAFVSPAVAQVAIAPSTVYIHDQTNIGTLYVSNRSDEPQEVSIEFAFGYPDSDAEGNLVMNYEDSVAFKRYALNDWIRAFPRSFVLGPHQQQTVRFQVRPIRDVDDGVYWTRVKVLATPQTPEIDETTTEEGITTRITFRFEQVIAAFYRKGRVTTGVDLTEMEVRHTSDQLIILPHLQRTGNAPFIGSMSARLIDSSGRVLAERETTTTAYFDEIRRIELSTSDVPAGTYRLELTFETKRGDISPTDLVQAPAMTRSVEVVIP